MDYLLHISKLPLCFLDKIKDCLEQVSEISRKGEDKITLSELKKEIKL